MSNLAFTLIIFSSVMHALWNLLVKQSNHKTVFIWWMFVSSGGLFTLTLPFLRAALDSLPFIKANRRIFFLGSWLGAFIGGQTSAEALAIVRRYLADHPRLDVDLRQKVLQNLDELERTVRIRKQQPTD